MMRHSINRLVTPALRSASARPLSTTSPALIKVRSSKPPPKPKPNTTPSLNPQATGPSSTLGNPTSSAAEYETAPKGSDEAAVAEAERSGGRVGTAATSPEDSARLAQNEQGLPTASASTIEQQSGSSPLAGPGHDAPTSMNPQATGPSSTMGNPTSSAAEYETAPKGSDETAVAEAERSRGNVGTAATFPEDSARLAAAGKGLPTASAEKIAQQTGSTDASTSAPPAAVEEGNFGPLPSLDIDPEAALPEPKPEGETEKKRTGAGKKEYVSSSEKQRRQWIRYGYGGLVLGALGAAYAVGGQNEAQSSSEGPVANFKSNFSELLDYFNKPAFKTLLPDPLPPPHQRPYTLVIDLEGLLVHSSWDRQSGWKTAKRPGVDYFLGYLSQFYEIVLFTSQPLYTAAPVAEKLDPYQAFLPYRLFRESTRYVKGKVVKDLSYLNRDLSKVILLDTNAEHAGLQPENSIIIPPWDGQPRDKGLVEMIPFLESIGIFNPADVRPILKAYEGKNIPVEYAKKEAEAKNRAVEEWERLHPTAVAGAGSGFLSTMFGSVAAPGQQRLNQPLTYLEQKRAQAQKIYQEEQKYWAENADEFKKLIEEDKQRQLGEMKGSLLGMFGPKPSVQEQK